MSTAALVVSSLLASLSARALWYAWLPHRSMLYRNTVRAMWTPHQMLLHQRAVGLMYGRFARSFWVLSAIFCGMWWLLRR